jgi:catechol 2,3-dioxygenase-like lactoylglutathione lyase family enzyme
MTIDVKHLIPMAFVADVGRSLEFYQKLGFLVGNTFTPPGAPAPSWAWLESGAARLMLAKAGEPVAPEQQAVLFYLYVEDAAATRAELVELGLKPGPIETPFHAPNGEFRLEDPDGYCLRFRSVRQ